MADITLIHTADIHCGSFERLRDRIAPGAVLEHIVRPDWLARAQGGEDKGLREEIAQTISATHTPVLCTCTTLGELAQELGAIRIDTSMMQKAAQCSGDIVLVYALDSTADASLAMLQGCVDAHGDKKKIHMLSLAEFWPLFVANEMTAFHASIAAAVRYFVQTRPDIGVIVLAQASMAGAEPLLSDLSQEVLSSPELALRHMLDARVIANPSH